MLKAKTGAFFGCMMGWEEGGETEIVSIKSEFKMLGI